MLQVICKTFAFSCCPDNVHVCAMSVCVRVLCVSALCVCALCNVCNSINFVHEMKTKTPHRDEDAATSRMFSSAIVCLACRLSGPPFSLLLQCPWSVPVPACPLVGLCYSALGLGAASREKKYVCNFSQFVVYLRLFVSSSLLSISPPVSVRVCVWYVCVQHGNIIYQLIKVSLKVTWPES